jgi:hypothetical protein
MPPSRGLLPGADHIGAGFVFPPWIDVLLLLEVEFPIGLDPTERPKVDADYVVVSTETFASLDLGLDAPRKCGVDTNTFDAVWK